MELVPQAQPKDPEIGRELFAEVNISVGTVLSRRTVYAFSLEVVIPDRLPKDSSWQIRSFSGGVVVEEQVGIAGFRLATEFLSVTYHLGTEDCD